MIRRGLGRRKGKRGTMTISKAKALAWMWFSRFIRLRPQANIPEGSRRCVTCGRVCPTKGTGAIHAGHFVPGRSNAVLYDEHNCHPQCFACNLYNAGAWVEYERFIISEYGEPECERLKALRFKVLHMSIQEHLEVAEKYRLKVEELGGW